MAGAAGTSCRTFMLATRQASQSALALEELLALELSLQKRLEAPRNSQGLLDTQLLVGTVATQHLAHTSRLLLGKAQSSALTMVWEEILPMQEVELQHQLSMAPRISMELREGTHREQPLELTRTQLWRIHCCQTHH